MHVQLPNTLVLPTETEVARAQGILPAQGIKLDRLVLNRRGRKVKFYFRQNRCKRCYSELTDEQVKALAASLQEIGKAGDIVFDNDVYHVSPKTVRLVK